MLREQEEARNVGIRDTLNQNPRITTGLTLGVILAVVVLLAWQIYGGGSPSPNAGSPATTASAG